tara:strand:+ start:1259 stop:1447 length:189 start_codon:yes stop_codon:yes gene_type:complete
MGKVLEKVAEKKEVVQRVDPNVRAIEKLTMLNGSIVEQIKALFHEIDSVKSKLAQVASRLGL